MKPTGERGATFRGSRVSRERRAAAKPTALPVKHADLTVTIRRFLKINVSPSQARVFLDGNYIGISDDWDDAGGGALLTFNLEGQHRLRICYPEYHDLLVDIVVRSTASDDKVTIEQELAKGTPDGPTGPEGKLPPAELQDDRRRALQRRAAGRDRYRERQGIRTGLEVVRRRT